MRKNISKLHAVDLEIVKEVVEICNDNNLLYYMIGGTMLGAIRHKGFIPWDDDIDLGMPREDYEKFLNLAPLKLSSHLKLVNYHTDSTNQYYITRIGDTNTKVVETRIANDSKYTHISIDLFPLDGSPNNTILRKLYYLKVMYHRAIMSLCYKDSIDPDRKRTRKEKLLLFIMTKIPIEKMFNPNKVKNKIDRIMRKQKVEKSNLIGCLMGAYRTREMVSKSIYGEGAFYQFENITLRGPQYYDAFLKHIYGDYMKLPPLESRKTHYKVIEINGEEIDS